MSFLKKITLRGVLRVLASLVLVEVEKREVEKEAERKKKEEK